MSFLFTLRLKRFMLSANKADHRKVFISFNVFCQMKSKGKLILITLVPGQKWPTLYFLRPRSVYTISANRQIASMAFSQRRLNNFSCHFFFLREGNLKPEVRFDLSECYTITRRYYKTT